MDWRAYIERVPGVMLGKPVFRDTRMTVEFVLDRLAQGAMSEEKVRSHPGLTIAHVRAALAYEDSLAKRGERLSSWRISLAEARLPRYVIAARSRLFPLSLGKAASDGGLQP